MEKETYYRFELAFNGVPEDVGLLQGLTVAYIVPEERDPIKRVSTKPSLTELIHCAEQKTPSHPESISNVQTKER